ncbi:MAG: hypothetical protein NC225_11435 [Clostridium sp.]|nr:hypothetical protein [Clostridium sp.]MCM1459646.1 hypothetical protein [Bacteroides sp.]
MTERWGHYCPNCGTILELDGFSTCRVVVDTIHHDAVYEYVDEKIIDKAAEDEQVVDYYKCSCGETKK